MTIELDIVEQDDGVTRLNLAGRLDVQGASAVDMQFNVVSGSKKKVIVDLAGVDFIASLGIRTLVMSAKAISSKGGRMVLLKPQANVEQALKFAGIDSMIPIAKDLASATAMVS